MVSAVGGDNGDAYSEEILTELVRDTSLSSNHQDVLLTLLIDYSDVFARSMGLGQCFRRIMMIV